MNLKKVRSRLRAGTAGALAHAARDIGYEIHRLDTVALGELRSELARSVRASSSDECLGYSRALADILAARMAVVRDGERSSEAVEIIDLDARSIKSRRHLREILLALGEQPRRTGELAEAFRLDTTAVSRALREMKQAGFVELLDRDGVEDGRSRTYGLTLSGRAVVARLADGARSSRPLRGRVELRSIVDAVLDVISSLAAGHRLLRPSLPAMLGRHLPSDAAAMVAEQILARADAVQDLNGALLIAGHEAYDGVSDDLSLFLRGTEVPWMADLQARIPADARELYVRSAALADPWNVCLKTRWRRPMPVMRTITEADLHAGDDVSIAAKPAVLIYDSVECLRSEIRDPGPTMQQLIDMADFRFCIGDQLDAPLAARFTLIQRTRPS
jgi:DNA-binding MarR family transcriptional regulator